jgi:hypothetical protein
LHLTLRVPRARVCERGDFSWLSRLTGSPRSDRQHSVASRGALRPWPVRSRNAYIPSECEEHARASPGGKRREPFEAQGKQAPALHMTPVCARRIAQITPSMLAGHDVSCPYEDKARRKSADVVARRIRREIPRLRPASRTNRAEQKNAGLRSE